MQADICPVMQEWWLPLQWPLASDKLLIKVFDADVGRDELVGTLFFSLKKLVELGQKTGGYYYWQNVYGAPKNISGVSAEVTKMDENPECASTWMGRFLMHIECTEDKQPVRKVEQIAPEIKQKAIDLGFFKDNEYDMIADVGMGVCLPTYDTAYTVKIKIAEHEFISNAPAEQRPGYNRWNDRIQKSFKTVYSQPETLDRVYVYLMSGEIPVCWWKGRVSDFMDPNPEYKWLNMKNDKAYGYVAKEYEAGMIQLKLSFNSRKKSGTIDFTKYEAWKRPPPRRLNNKIIRAFIYQMRNLPSADEDGSSDTFVEAWSPYGEDAQESKLQTAVIHDNNNPIFFETLQMTYDLENLKNAPPVILNIWDTDYGSTSKDNYIGRAVIRLSEAASNLSEENKGMDCEAVPRPRWHPIRIGFDEKSSTAGEILCSFIIADSDHIFKIPTKSFKLGTYVEQTDFTLEVNVMGLRELESFGLMPIRKPYINLRAKSLLPPEKHDSINNVKTDPNEGGPNPNINNTLAFNIALPTDDLFCPSLSCDVYDYVYLGMSQPLIGTFVLDIGKVMEDQKKKRDREKIMFSDIIEFLTERAGLTQKEMVLKTKKSAVEDLSAGAKKHLKQETRKQKENKQKQLEREASLKEKRLSLTGEQQEGEKPAKYDTYGGDQNVSINDRQETDDIEKLVATERRSTQGLFGWEEEDLDDVVRKEYELFEKTLQDMIDFKKTHSKKLSLAEKTALASLKRKYLEQKEIYVAAQKKAKKEKMDADNALLKMLGKWTGSAAMNVLCPRYRFDEGLNFYVEEDTPPETLFRPVGFNNLQTVRDLMEGDEHTRKERKLTEEEGKERLMAGTNKHYRRFYEDELENDRKLFPEMPFLKVPVMRGQSRGLQKSWFSWGSDAVEDESGEQSNEKQVGYFKGKVRVYNKTEENLNFYEIFIENRKKNTSERNVRIWTRSWN